jgi:multicomponent Na+:H+ antiporter subunit F
VNAWLIAATALLAGLVPLFVVALRAPRIDAVVALEVAGTIVTLVLLCLAEGFARSAYSSTAITLAVVSFVGALLYARILERSR